MVEASETEERGPSMFDPFLGKLTAVRGRILAVTAVATTAVAGLVAGTASSSQAAAGHAASKTVKVALILKTFSNPYFVSMEKSAKADAKKLGVQLTVSAGTTDGDTATQI